MSESRSSVDIATGPLATPRPTAGPSTSSNSVFHAPHPAHCPDHLGWAVPHSAHECTVFVLVMAAA